MKHRYEKAAYQWNYLFGYQWLPSDGRGMEIKMKILVLAGGFDQIALIQELKSRGHIVYLADYFENPPAKPYADKHFQISTLDEDAVYQLALNEKVDLITTACTDQALMTVASVSERLQLQCYVSSETARNVTNKAFMKKKFSEYSIPTAKWTLLEDEKHYKKELPSQLCYPLIVKPCDCNSSKGVVKVNNDKELEEAIVQAFQLSRSKKVVVEDFKEGEEVSIDVWKDSEGAKIMSVSGTGKIAENEENFTIYQSKYPIDMSDKLIERIQDTAGKICMAFDLDNCPLLIQAIIKDDEISVIEFSARMGGGSKYKLIEYMAGVPIMKTYVNRILGDTTQIVKPIWSDKKIELNYVYTYNGIVKEIVGFDKFIENGDIKEFFQYRPLGCETEKMTTSSDRICGFLIEEESFEKLLRLRHKIVEEVDVLDNSGKSIMFKKCFFS